LPKSEAEIVLRNRVHNYHIKCTTKDVFEIDIHIL
jgi:hypothetical protein